MKYVLIFLIVVLNISSTKAQVADLKIVDSIYKSIKGIKTILDDTESYKEEIKIFKKQHLRDSLSLNKKEDEIANLLASIESLKKEKADFNIKKKELQDSLILFQSDYSNIFDKQIDILLNEKFDSQSRLLLSSNLLKSMLNFAQKSSSKKLIQLNYFIEIYDSISSVNKIFDFPYSEIQTKETLKKLNLISGLVKQKMPNNKVLLSELEYLAEKTKNYCKKTLDLFNHFYTYESLAKADINQFKNKVSMGYYYASEYNYLIDLLNKFLEEPTYRAQFPTTQKEQFKIKPPFTCN